MPINHKLDLNVHLIHLRFSPGFSPVGRLHLSLLSRSRAEAERISKTCLASQAAISWSRWEWNTQLRFLPSLALQALAWPSCHQGTPLAPRAAAGVALAPGCSTAAISVHLHNHCCKGPTRSALGPPGTDVRPPRSVGAAKQELTRLRLWNQSQALSKGQRK